MKIKKNDLVKMIAGKDNGKTGKVLSVSPERNKISVEGLNMIKKHVRARKEGQKGQRVEVARNVDISNVALICSKCGKATRVGYKKIEGNKKVRVCKKCQSEI